MAATAGVDVEAPTSRIRAAGRSPLRRREARAAWVFLAPSAVLFGVFAALPAIASLVIGFTDWNGLGSPEWVGLRNYQRLVRDPLFLRSLGNTFLYTGMFVVLTTLVSVGVAVLLDQRLRGISAVRFLWILPVLTDLVSVSLVWGWLYHAQFGIINYVTSLVGIPPVSWLGDTRSAMIALVILSTWRWAGYYSVILVAALKAVPQELVEAASVDGATGWASFTRVKLPLISPALFLIVVLEIISSMQVFEQMWVLTNGGPQDSTISVAMYLYIEAFKFLRLGYASAVAWVLFLIVLIITVINWVCRRFWVYED